MVAIVPVISEKVAGAKERRHARVPGSRRLRRNGAEHEFNVLLKQAQRGNKAERPVKHARPRARRRTTVMVFAHPCKS